jgi:hypothetical protein
MGNNVLTVVSENKIRGSFEVTDGRKARDISIISSPTEKE